MGFSIQKYFTVLKKILGPKGCPWSKDQTVSSICHHVIEEAYEVLDAQKEEKSSKVGEELGDLYFTVSFLTALILDEYKLDFDGIVEKGCEKIVRRTPHVFENPREISLEELRIEWEEAKAKERLKQNENPLNSIASSLPLTLRAMKWVELANKYGYEESLESGSLGDEFLKLINRGAGSSMSINHVFEDRLRDFEKNFRNWMATKRELQTEE